MTVPAFLPTEEQRAVLEHRGQLLVLAGAGVGKTTLLTERVINTIEGGRIPPEKILAVTFTHAAANEMRSRITEKLRERGDATASNEVVVQTYHGFGGQIVREFGMRVGISPKARLLNEAEKWGLLEHVLDRLTFNTIEIRSAGHAFKNILSFVKDAQNHLLTPDDIQVYVEQLRNDGLAPKAEPLVQQWEEMAHAFATYQRIKLETGAIDYGDQIAHAVEIMRSFPTIAARIRARHPYIFVDEYQDSNPAQRELLLELIDPIDSNLFVIGDDDQAIFRFQGANVRNILRLPDEPRLAPNPPSVLTLVGNRRSKPPILDIANRIAHGMTEREPKTLTHLREGQATVGAYVADTEQGEAAWIASKISDLRGLGSDEHQQYAWGDFAVLSRTHETLNVVEQTLKSVNIPSTRARREPLLECIEVDQIRAMLQVLVTPDNDVAMARVLSSPRWRLTELEMRALARHRCIIQAQSEATAGNTYVPRPALIDAVMDVSNINNISPETRHRLCALIDEIQHLTTTAQLEALTHTVKNVIDRGAYLQELSVNSEPEHIEARTAVDAFTTRAASFGGTGLYGVRAFLRFLDRAEEAGDTDISSEEPPAADSSQVLLSTIHTAKGREWPVVFIAGLVTPQKKTAQQDAPGQAPYPLRAQRADLPHFPDEGFTNDSAFLTATEHRDDSLASLAHDDERRLMYVALTRARDHLYVSRAHWAKELKNPQVPVSFWDEILDTGYCVILGDEPVSPANPSLTNPLPPNSKKRSARTSTAEKIEALLSANQVDEALAVALDGHSTDKTWKSVLDNALMDLNLTQSPHRIPEAPENLSLSSTSYSALNNFQACPRRYRHRYIDHLPSRPNPSQQVGSTVHRILAAASSHVSDVLIDDDDHIDGDLHRVLADHPELLERFRKSRWGQRPATYAELEFTLSVNNQIIRGSIDRVDRLENGTLEIVDFKTGKHRSSEELQSDLQLPIYALAASELLGTQPEQIRASLFFLGSDHEWSLDWSIDAATHARRTITKLLKTMTTSMFPKTEDRSKCRQCDFAHICGR